MPENLVHHQERFGREGTDPHRISGLLEKSALHQERLPKAAFSEVRLQKAMGLFERSAHYSGKLGRVNDLQWTSRFL